MYVNLLRGVSLIVIGGAILGAGEVYQQRRVRIFSNGGDSLHEGAARGLVRSMLFIGRTIQEVPKIWMQETKN